MLHWLGFLTYFSILVSLQRCLAAANLKERFDLFMVSLIVRRSSASLRHSCFSLYNPLYVEVWDYALLIYGVFLYRIKAI